MPTIPSLHVLRSTDQFSTGYHYRCVLHCIAFVCAFSLPAGRLYNAVRLWFVLARLHFARVCLPRFGCVAARLRGFCVLPSTYFALPASFSASMVRYHHATVYYPLPHTRFVLLTTCTTLRSAYLPFRFTAARHYALFYHSPLIRYVYST